MPRPSTRAAALALVVMLPLGGCGPQVLTDTRPERPGVPVIPSTPGTPGTPAVPDGPSTTPDTAPSTGPPQPAGTVRGSVTVLGTAASGIPVPWGLAALPDGTVLVTSRDEHHLYRVAPRTGAVVDLGEVEGVQSDPGAGDEGGLLGVAVSPSFTTDKQIYLYCSTATDNRVVRVTLIPGSPATLSSPTVVLDGIPRGLHHNGGSLAFGPGGQLYVGTGDTDDPALAADLDSLAGKVLRMTPGGRPAPGNPFVGSVVYSYGHRDVQGMTVDAHRHLFAVEPGEGTAAELNWIRPGRNYGWPAPPEGTVLPGLTGPIAQVGTAGDSSALSSGVSSGGVAFAGGSLFLAAPPGERLWRIPLRGTVPVAPPRAFLTGEVGRLRGVIALADRELLVTAGPADAGGSSPPGRLLLLQVD